MSHSMNLDEKLGVIVLRYWGTLDFNEIRNVFDELVELPGFRPALCLIADFRGSNTPLTGDDVKQLAIYAERTDAAWGETKWALLASKDVTFGLARMYMALTDHHQVIIHVFRNAREADGWLGLGIEMEQILACT